MTCFTFSKKQPLYSVWLIKSTLCNHAWPTQNVIKIRLIFTKHRASKYFCRQQWWTQTEPPNKIGVSCTSLSFCKVKTFWYRVKHFLLRYHYINEMVGKCTAEKKMFSNPDFIEISSCFLDKFRGNLLPITPK